MDELKEQIRKVSEQLKGKTVYAFGSFNNVSMLQTELESYDIRISVILDNDKKKTGSAGTFRVRTPEAELLPYQKDAAVLIYSPRYWKEMLCQVRALGYKRSQIFVLNSKTAEGSSLLKLFSGIRRVAYGRKVYRRILRGQEGPFEILIMRGATGDVYLNGLFLQEYMVRRPGHRIFIAGDSKGLAKVLRLFDFPQDCIFPLNEDQTTALLRYGIFCSMEKMHMKNTFLWHWTLASNRSRVRLSQRFSFMDTYRHLIYQAQDSGHHPVFIPAVDVRSVFSEHYLQEGKTVVLAPVAYSVEMLPIWFWEKLAENLRERGYSVCASLAKEEEKDYPFVTPIFMPFDSCVEFLERSGAFIALRSGLCDIVSSAKCKKIILYPSNKPKTDDSIHRCDLAFSGLNVMNLCDDAIEFESEAINDILVAPDYRMEIDREAELNRLIEKILDFF